MGVTSRWILGLTHRYKQQTRMDEHHHSRLGVRLGVFLLRARYLPSDDIFSNVVLLAQVEEPSDLGRTFGAESLGEDVVGQPRDFTLTLLDNDDGKDSDVWADDAPADGLALALTVATSAVARVPIGEEKADTIGKQDTLFHGEPLLVVSAGDAKDVALPLVSQCVSLDFLCHFLVEKYAAGQR